METYKISLYEVCCDMKNDNNSREENPEQNAEMIHVKPECVVLPGTVELENNSFCKCGSLPHGSPLSSSPGSQVHTLKARRDISKERTALEQLTEKMCHCKLIKDCQNSKTVITKADESSCKFSARFASVHDIAKLMSETNQFKQRLLFFESGSKTSPCYTRNETPIASRYYDYAGNFIDDAIDDHCVGLENIHCTSLEEEKELDMEIECKSNPCICQEAYSERMHKRQGNTAAQQKKAGPDLLQINACVAASCRQSF